MAARPRERGSERPGEARGSHAAVREAARLNLLTATGLFQKKKSKTPLAKGVSTVECGICLQFEFAKVAQQLGSVGLRWIAIKKRIPLQFQFAHSQIAIAATFFSPPPREQIQPGIGGRKRNPYWYSRGVPYPPGNPALV